MRNVFHRGSWWSGSPPWWILLLTSTGSNYSIFLTLKYHDISKTQWNVEYYCVPLMFYGLALFIFKVMPCLEFLRVRLSFRAGLTYRIAREIINRFPMKNLPPSYPLVWERGVWRHGCISTTMVCASQSCDGPRGWNDVVYYILHSVPWVGIVGVITGSWF